MLQLSDSERQTLERTFLNEVVQKYNHWRNRHSLLAAITLSRSNSPLPAGASLPDLMPREFTILPREKLGRPQAALEHQVDLYTALEKHGDLIVLGGAGAGKTTALWRMAYEYARRAHVEMRSPLPFMVQLGRYDGRLPILDFIRAELLLASKMDASGDIYPAHRQLAGHLEEYLEAHRLCLLFDAVDEMPREGYGDSMHRLAIFLDRQRGNRFVFSCRPADYVVRFDLNEVTLEDLDEQAQQRLLINALPHGTRILAHLDQEPELAELARQPFWLLALGYLDESGNELPNRATRVLERLMKKLWLRAVKKNPGRQVADEVVWPVLSNLAFQMQEEYGIGTSAPRAWAERHLTGHVRVDGREADYHVGDLLFIARQAFILEEGPDGALRFSHILVQQYLAAVALKRLGLDSPDADKAVRYQQWDETLVLLAGLGEAGPLVKRLLTLDPFLAACCAAAGRNVQPRALDALSKRLIKKLGSNFRRERIAAAEALGALGTEQVISPILALVGEQDPVAQAALRRIILRLPAEPLFAHLFRLLRDKDPGWRAWAVGIVRDLKGRRALPYLVRLIGDPEPTVRVEVARTLSSVIGEGAIPYLFLLLRDNHHVVRTAAAQALVQFRADALLREFGPLTKRTPNSPIPDNSPLNRNQEDVLISRLVALMQDNLKEVRWVAAEMLSGWKVEGLAPYLMPLLNDSDANVRWLTGKVLASIQAEEAMPQLVSLLRVPDAGLRVLGAETLSRISGEAAIPHIAPLLQDNDWYVRAVVVQALERTRSAAAVPYLVPLLSDADPFVRWLTARVLVELRAQEAVPQLIYSLQDENAYVRKSAVDILGELKAEAAVPELLRLLKDKAQEVRGAAAQALGEIHQEQVIPHLVPLLQDQDRYVRTSAAEALTKLGANAALPHLLPMMGDNLPPPDRSAFRGLYEGESERSFLVAPSDGDDRAMDALYSHMLAANNSETAIAHFVELLKHEDDDVRMDAQRTLEANAREIHLPLITPLLMSEDPRVYNAAFEIVEAIRRRLNLPKDYQNLRDF